MKKEEKMKIKDIIDSIRPYITSESELNNTVDKITKKSSNLDEFKNNLKESISKEEDPTIEADYKILLNKLESR